MGNMTIERERAAVQMMQTSVDTRTGGRWGYRFAKRCFDLIGALLVSLILLLPMLIIAIVVMVKDFGSPFYAQHRLGKGGKVIRVYKFRSMKKGADDLERMLSPEQLEEYRQEYKLKDDPRLLGYKKEGDGERCFGAVIRRTSIDELPQILFNILIRGNMSVVGPRPILPDELEENYTPEEQTLLLSVKPGLTGYWQAYARNNATYASRERQDMELYYVRNRSFGLDMKIILQTVVSVLRKDGAQ